MIGNAVVASWEARQSLASAAAGDNILYDLDTCNTTPYAIRIRPHHTECTLAYDFHFLLSLYRVLPCTFVSLIVAITIAYMTMAKCRDLCFLFRLLGDRIHVAILLISLTCRCTPAGTYTPNGCFCWDCHIRSRFCPTGRSGSTRLQWSPPAPGARCKNTLLCSWANFGARLMAGARWTAR